MNGKMGGVKLVSVDASKIKSGVWYPADLAGVFGVSVSTFYRRKDEYFKILEKYCTIEKLGRGYFLEVK